MATSIFTAIPLQTSDAEFRAWGSAYVAGLLACGLVKTADTGQIDWATVAKPAAGNASQGYEIWRFNDALQATAPVIIKIEFGSGAGATTPAIYITIGKATDGAGTLTGLTTTRKQLAPTTSSAGAGSCRFSGATNRILCLFCYNVVNCEIAWGLERTHDAAGADTAEGVLLWTNVLPSTCSTRYFSMSGGEGQVETTFGALMPSAGSGSTGSAVAVYPIFFTKGIFCNPLRDLLIGFTANFTVGVQISFTHYGATRLFMPVSTLVPNTGRVSSGTLFLIRDE